MGKILLLVPPQAMRLFSLNYYIIPFPIVVWQGTFLKLCLSLKGGRLGYIFDVDEGPILGIIYLIWKPS